MKFLSIVLGSVFLSLAMPALADESYTCSHGDKQRVITIKYAVEGQAVPCQVDYQKDTGTQTLWRADNKTGFCEDKTAEFVAKQESWGWACAKDEVTPVEPAAAPAS